MNTRNAIPAGNSAPNGGWGFVFALMLALRMLTPVGFMPVVDGGGLSLSVCPDAGPMRAAPMHHHHGKAPKAAPHQPCPYAAAAQPFVAADAPALLDVAALPPIAIRPIPVRALAASQFFPRPPSRAPPAKA